MYRLNIFIFVALGIALAAFLVGNVNVGLICLLVYFGLQIIVLFD